MVKIVVFSILKIVKITKAIYLEAPPLLVIIISNGGKRIPISLKFTE